VLKNNIAFPNKNSQIGTCWEKISSQDIDHYVDCPAGENNTWNLNLDLTEDDFASLDDPSMTVTGEDLSTIPGILGPRQADGSLPDVDFLRLKKGSRAIDKGEDVGFPFEGDAPDLGAFEYGLKVSNIAAMPNRFTEMPDNATVFDLQGRNLGTLQTMPKKPGVYLVRYGKHLQKKYIK
jgi:hypothetical protein